MSQVRRLTEDDGVGLTDDPTGQRLRIRVRREVVAFLADLLDATRGDHGAGMVAFNTSVTYPEGSVGAAVKSILLGGGGGGGPIDPGVLVAALTGLLGPDQLTSTLRARIDTIDQPGGLTAQVAALTTTYGSTAAAAVSAANAATSATNAVTAQTNAVAASNAAAVSAGQALTSANDSASARTQAQTAEGNASTSATQAAGSATSAAGSAATATTQATVATQAASAAGGSAAAASTSASSATSSATAAATSASAADQRRVDAQTAAASASTSATNAAQSATTAAGSAATASTQAGLAAAAAGNADSSAAAAATSAASSSVSATNAATSAATASTQAGLAATSSNAAGNSATAASNSASSAATAASAASTAASAATTAKVSAETAASSASVSSGSAATSASSASGFAAAAASSYDATVAATGSLTAQVSSLQTAVAGPNGLTAQSVFKVSATRADGKKVYGAIGLAATAAGDAGESQILLDASKLLFVPNSDLDAVPSNLMTLGLVGGVATLVVPAARIGDATITPQKMSVTNLAAITANLGAVTAGTITLTASGHIKSGQTDWNTGNGFFIGVHGGEPALSIGSSTGARLTYKPSEGLKIINPAVVSENRAVSSFYAYASRTVIAPATAAAAVTLLSDGRIQRTRGTTTDIVGNWYLPTTADIGAQFDMVASATGDTILNPAVLNREYSLAAGASFGLQQSGGFGEKRATMSITLVRRSTGVVEGTGTAIVWVNADA